MRKFPALLTDGLRFEFLLLPLFFVTISQADFLVERLGGPKLYTQRKGKYYRLIARHAPYDLNLRSAARWLEVSRRVESPCSLRHSPIVFALVPVAVLSLIFDARGGCFSVRVCMIIPFIPHVYRTLGSRTHRRIGVTSVQLPCQQYRTRLRALSRVRFSTPDARRVSVELCVPAFILFDEAFSTRGKI